MRRVWQGPYIRRIAAGDAVIAAVASVVGYLVQFGPETRRPSPAQPSV